MDVLPNDEETMVLRAASEFLAGESTTALVRAAEKTNERWSPELWRKIAELGWLGLSLPEEFGGQDLPLTYLGLLFEEVGRHIAPIPMLSVMVPALILARHGSPAQRDLLPRVITGDRLLTYAVAEMDGRWSLDAIQTTGHREGGHLVLSGRKAFVDNFLAADHCLVAFRMRDSRRGCTGTGRHRRRPAFATPPWCRPPATPKAWSTSIASASHWTPSSARTPPHR